MESTSNSDKTTAYNEMCRRIVQANPPTPNKMKPFDKFKANFRFYVQQCTRKPLLLKTLISVATVGLVNGTIYYNYGPDHPCNLILWFYYKRNDKLTTEQLWKSRMVSEYQRSFYQNLDRSYYTSERDKKINTMLF
ncbi:unnamed protein product [Meloidogyne enterolobii]|uniref:Uncharacterized protein n=1 Tax=Meloidogyne enterolobii TaxID=390850 RepID=A0ACB0Z4Z4_MELEN